MPEKPSPTTAPNPYAKLRRTLTFDHLLTELIVDRLLADLIFEPDENRALRKLREWRRTVRKFPGMSAILRQKPPGKPGRPRGSRSLNWRQCVGAVLAVDALHRNKADVLRACGRGTDRTDYPWLDRRLKYGREELKKLGPEPKANLFNAIQRHPNRWAKLKALLTDSGTTPPVAGQAS